MSRGRVAAAVVLVVLVALCAGLLVWPAGGDTPSPPEPVAAAVAPAQTAERAPEDVDAPIADTVECELSETVIEVDDLVVEELDPERLEPVRTHVPQVHDRRMWFRPLFAAGIGRVSSRRHLPRPVAWIDGACTNLVELDRLPHRRLSGRVDGVIEVGAVAVHVRCGDEGPIGFSGSVGADGALTFEVPAREACAAQVGRVFGGRDLVSAPLSLPSSGDVADLVLTVPPAPGHGLGLHPVDGGLRVYGVAVGSAAERAGVEMLDLVVAIDDEPAGELDLELVLEDTSPMALDIIRDGQPLRIDLR